MGVSLVDYNVLPYSLDIVGRAWDLSQSNVPHSPSQKSGCGCCEGYVEEMRGEEGVGNWIGMRNEKKIVCLLFSKINK